MRHLFEVWLTTGLCALLGSLVAGQTETGDWAEWSDPSVCSRTCGGGVQSQHRWCLSDDLSDCSGPTQIFSSCNTQDCPPGSGNFRAEQCAKYDQVAFKGEYSQWLPYYGGPDKCALYCLAKGKNFYFQHAAKVIDGTPCDRNSTEICVDGVCQEVGCDRKLGSSAVYDKCHICGGDGSGCRTKTGYIDTQTHKYGYNDLVLIPKGATSLSFREEHASGNYLAVRSLSGEYFLNGHFIINLPPKRTTIAGTDFLYTSGSQGADSLGADSLSAEGATDQPVFISLLNMNTGPSPRIYYEYSLPLEVKDSSDLDTYSWSSGGWSQCTASCATGQQTRQVNCVQNSDGTHVASELCNHSNKPDDKQDCNTEPCPAHWHVGTWDPCSTSCGEGHQARSVFCQQRRAGDQYFVVDSKLCPQDKPPKVQACNKHIECPQWEVQEWSKCNRVCGAGRQIRRVVCQARHPLPGAMSDLLADSHCDSATKPEDEKECFIQPCEGLEWITSQWSGCQGTCADGYETRQVVCSNKFGKVHKNEECDPAKLPATRRECAEDRDRCDRAPRWHASEWEQCSARCGPGVQSREVVCLQQLDPADAQSLTVVDSSLCDPNLKMEEHQDCVGTDCKGVWFEAPWGKCSAPCGSGERFREVLCFWQEEVASLDQCDPDMTPFSMESCTTYHCNDDDLLPVGGCKNTEFGCCPDGISRAEGENYFGCPSRDRIPVGLCVESEFGCCLDGVTAAQGPFLGGCPHFSCLNKEFGCCESDGETPAGGPNQEGCPEKFSCKFTAFGCCPDNETPALGINDKGCEPLCASSLYGCCKDGITMAQGEKREGCEDEDEEEGSGEAECEPGSDGSCNILPVGCKQSVFGCCPDGVSEASGPKLAGCEGVVVVPESGCASTTFGCCPDDKTPALGPEDEGCESTEVEITCDETYYGCCPDQVSIAQGDNFQGCPKPPLIGGCAGTRFGCCPGSDKAAGGDNNEGCITVETPTCHDSLYGCCLDRKTFAQGQQYEGCPGVTERPHSCDHTTFGCCRDGVSTAIGPDFQGCDDQNYTYTCSDAPFKCCPDGKTFAQGPNHAGCPHRLDKGGVCGLPKARGECSNFTVKWYFDVTIGDCARFWYGGCGGTQNRFSSKIECNQTCIDPKLDTLDVCYLPKSIGKCSKTEKRFYYNPDTASCEEFAYGGCRGNRNNFETLEECEHRCEVPQRPDVCSQPFNTGPCRGNFLRWFYDESAKVCREFTYGGCKGNDNRFETRENCEQRCNQTATSFCQLPKDVGPCRADFRRWHFNTQTQRCQEFTWGGCGGNHNRFGSKGECEKACDALIPKKVVNICQLPGDAGPCSEYYERWYYNRSTGYCEQFVYGGCEGNDNQFVTESDCRETCSAREHQDVCTLPSIPGDCSKSVLQFYFDSHASICKEFIYSGCGSNGNNFDTIEECNKACHHLVKPLITNKCQLLPEMGPCIKNIPRWFYNSSAMRCEEFVYGGCEGNRNRFQTRDNCERECDSVEPPVTPLPVYTSTQPAEDVCGYREDPGNCYDYYPMWYYDGRLNRCLQFVYTGCGGNTNRFHARMDCETRCVKKEPEDLSLDVCVLPSKRGACVDEISRWYYDTEKGRCLPFTYSGCHGNKNSFATESECRKTCPVTEICALPAKVGNCRASKVRYYYDSEEGKCRKFYYGGCKGNANRFVDIANCERTCVPKKEKPIFTGDTCTQEKDAGSCTDYAMYWYYDSNARRCGQFYYGGCEGNGNRFESRAECEGRCTPTTTTLSTLSGEEAPDQCKERKKSGSCMDYTPMWYFDHVHGLCRRFLYGGCGGNGNRYNTRQECRNLCVYGIGGGQQGFTTSPTPKRAWTTPRREDRTTKRSWTTKRWWTTPRRAEETTKRPDKTTKYWWTTARRTEVTTKRMRTTTETTLSTTHMRPIIKTTDRPTVRTRKPFTTSTPTRTTKPMRAVTTTPRTTPRTTQTTTPQPTTAVTTRRTTDRIVARDRCLRPQRRGRCSNYEVRWHFDSVRAECKRFWYGGCGSNGNNFDSKESCERQCKLPRAGWPVSSSPNTACSLPVHRGVCGAMLSRWYFDPLSETCKEFMFEGCLGNGNNFLSQAECLTQCSRKKEGDICSLPRDVGPCKANKPKWYYDTTEGRCLEFSYGGCRGNRNNFETEGDCLSLCGTQTTVATVKSRDVCSLPRDTDPCVADFLRYYYDSLTGECRPFSGCQVYNHAVNNFESQRECYEVCTDFPDAFPILQPGDCYEPDDHGPCQTGEVRYHFNPSLGDCEMFSYGGCGGNGNNFRTYEDCLAYCSRVTWTCGVLECDKTCDHGFARGDDGCPYCACADACQGYECPDGYKCILEEVICVTAPCLPVPVCSPLPKEGECPVLEADQSLCLYECDNDQDCPHQAKCCDTGCGKICASPGAPNLGDFDPTYYYHYEEESGGDKTGRCPPLDDVLPGSCVDTCRRDSDCPATDKCCSNGCGLECLPATLTTLISSTMSPSSLPTVMTTPGCASHVFGCCPDGLTPAQGWNYIGCKEEAPVIEAATLTVVVRVGDTVHLPCSASGAPTPQISWYRNRIPLMGEDARLTHHQDGSLQISDIRDEDDSQYSCRAYNSVGSDTRTYTVIVHEPPSFLSTPTVVHGEEGGNASLECRARGNPAPSVRWLKGEELVVIDGSHVREEMENQLVIVGLRAGDAGKYRCELNNGVGRPLHREIMLHVQAKALEASIKGSRESYNEGDDVELICVTSASSNYTVTWYKDGMRLERDDNTIDSVTSSQEVLFLESLTPEDKGVYECVVERGAERVQVETAIDVKSVIDSDCEDNPALANCKLIVKFGYCDHTYYKDICCKSCTAAGYTY